MNPTDAQVEAGAEALFRHFNDERGYKWPAPEQHLPWWRAAARAVLEAVDTPVETAEQCGKPRRYFPQQTCELARGHEGLHEDATHIWGDA